MNNILVLANPKILLEHEITPQKLPPVMDGTSSCLNLFSVLKMLHEKRSFGLQGPKQSGDR